LADLFLSAIGKALGKKSLGGEVCYPSTRYRLEIVGSLNILGDKFDREIKDISVFLTKVRKIKNAETIISPKFSTHKLPFLEKNNGAEFPREILEEGIKNFVKKIDDYLIKENILSVK
jgi:hypothetical protein